MATSRVSPVIAPADQSRVLAMLGIHGDNGDPCIGLTMSLKIGKQTLLGQDVHTPIIIICILPLSLTIFPFSCLFFHLALRRLFIMSYFDRDRRYVWLYLWLSIYVWRFDYPRVLAMLGIHGDNGDPCIGLTMSLKIGKQTLLGQDVHTPIIIICILPLSLTIFPFSCLFFHLALRRLFIMSYFDRDRRYVWLYLWLSIYVWRFETTNHTQ